MTSARTACGAAAAAAVLAAGGARAQVPASSAKRPITVDEAITARLVSDPQLSPDGEWVLFAMTTTDLASNARSTGTYLVGAAGGVPRPYPGGAIQATAARWSPDGRRIAYIAGGQLWVADPSGNGRVQVTELAGGAAGPVWSPAGNRIAFTSAVTPSCDSDACNAEQTKRRALSVVKAHIADSLMYRHWNAWDDGTRRHLFVVFPEGGTPLDLTPRAPYDIPPGPDASSDGYAFSPDGKEIAFTAKDQGRAEAWSTDANLYLAPVAGGTATVITAGNRGADADPVYSPDGRYIAYASQARPGAEADRRRVMVYDRASGTAHELFAGWDRSADRVAFTPDGKAMLIEAVDAARTKFFRVALVDRPGGAVGAEGAPAPIVSERNNSALSIDRSGRVIVWLRDAIDHPPEVMAAALSPGGVSSVHALTRVNDSLLAAVRLYPAEDFWFKSVHGDSVQGMVVRPPQWTPQASYPVVLLIHGGPQGEWLDSWHTRWNAQLFAAPGYGVVLVNPRGSIGYGQRFTDEVSRDWGGAAHVDLMNGLDAALARFSWLDTARLAAAGGSYGGYMVDWIAGHSRRFAALISHAGVYDLEAMSGATDELWFVEQEFGGPYWDPLAMATQYRTWSPHLYAKEFRTPMLVIAGEQDYRVPYTESLALFSALQRQGVPSRLIIFPDEGHWIGKPRNRQLWYDEVQAWLARWLAVPGAPGAR